MNDGETKRMMRRWILAGYGFLNKDGMICLCWHCIAAIIR